ncbi:MAG: aldo/keto reductase [Pirellulales bacterium]|nr:aldo/keto reductase [Pirellulales bacterium]
MQQRALGGSGIEASVIGLGTWATGGWMWGGTDEADAVRAIHASLDHGVNLIDTAPMYGFGRSEELVGRAIAGRRDEVVLATKCGLVWGGPDRGEFFFHSSQSSLTAEPSRWKVYRYLHPDSIREELEASLRRLGTDHVDLYQTHWQDSTTPIDDTMAALVKLREVGKIRAIGVSNVSLAQLREYGQVDAAQEKYSMLDRQLEENGILEHCRAEGIAVLAYSPLAGGLLTGAIGPDRTFPEGDLRRGQERYSVENRRRIKAMLDEFEPIARARGLSLGQLVVAWTFSQPGVTHVLCGARRERHALENAAAGAAQLSADELTQMGQILQRADV